MNQMIVTYLPWFMSIVTIYMTFQAGNKNRWSWLIGLCNQVFWLTWIIASASWGLLPMTIVLTGLYLRNHMLWFRSS